MSVSGGRVVVLGGGGVAGIAWETGILHGLLDAGVDLDNADATIGTSAGAYTGSYLALGTVTKWYAAQTAGQEDEIAPPPAEEWLVDIAGAIEQGGGDPVATCRALAAVAERRAVVSPPERMAVVRSRLDAAEWPDATLLVPVIDADSGELHVLSRDSGVPFMDAVAASSAVPGMWPVVSAGGRRWIDGACISANNVGLARGADVVIVIAPQADGFIAGASGLLEEAETLRAAGSRVEVVVPDTDSTAVLGGNPFDPSVREAAAEAGQRQAATCASPIASAWNHADVHPTSPRDDRA